ncbi:unnamed protein product [Rhodiola kirilowii]
MGHRQFLPMSHPYTRQKATFNGEIDHRVTPQPAFGFETFERIRDFPNNFRKPNQCSEYGPWKKRSIFWDLLYWTSFDVRHCIDVMHVKKNICDSVIGTLLNVHGKMKDGIKVRLDMVDMNIRTQLVPETQGQRTYLLPACTTLSRSEKESFCGCLK